MVVTQSDFNTLIDAFTALNGEWKPDDYLVVAGPAVIFVSVLSPVAILYSDTTPKDVVYIVKRSLLKEGA